MQLTFFDAGQLTARLELEAAIEVPDGQGGVTSTHEATASLWARIEPVDAALDELGHVDRQAITHRIWIRHADGVLPGMRFRKAMRVFSIRTVHDPDDSRRYLVCRVTEEV